MKCELVEKISAILSKGKIDRHNIKNILEITRESIPSLAEELCNQDWEPGRYILYKDQKHGFVVMMLVWGIGNKTPIHAHGTWGVEAVIKNKVKVTTYTYCNKDPKQTGEAIISAGDLAYVLPPDEDVHVVAQEGSLPSITVHIYGKELTENIVFSPGEGFKASPVTCKKVNTKFFDFSNWFHNCTHQPFGQWGV